MSFSDKDVLAARKLVATAHLVQAASLVVEGLGLGLLSRMPLSPCATSWHPMFNYPPFWLVWTYFAVRMFICLPLIPILYRLAPRLDRAQNASKDGLHTLLAKEWESLPCTILTNYLVFASMIIPHIFAIFRIRAALGVQKSWEELWSQWGQSAAFVVAIATILHVIYSFITLFGYKASEHRLSVARALNWDIKHEDPPRSWKTWFPWMTLAQRHPFLSTLHSPDELLTAKRQLLTVEERRLFLTPEQQNTLWDEVELGIKLNDIPGIHDSILRGAPVDRKDRHGDTLLHIAARVGNLALLQAVCTSASSNLLFVDNGISETPLETAIKANQVDAAKLILDEMKKKNIDEGKATLAKIFGIAIEADKLSTLFILITWPGWEELKVTIPGNPPQNIFECSIKNNKVEATKILLDHSASIFPSSPRLQKLFEYALFNGQQDIAALVAKYKPGSIRLDSSLISALRQGHSRVLLDTGSDPNALMASASSHQNLHIVEELLHQNLSVETLDYALTMTHWPFHGRGSGRTTNPEIIRRIQDTLRAKGGRSWHNFHEAATEGDHANMKSMIDAEGDIELVRRMVNCRTLKVSGMTRKYWNSMLHLFLYNGFMEWEARMEIAELINVLFGHGLSGNDQTSNGTTPLHLAAEWYIPANIFLTILEEVPTSNDNRVDEKGHTILHSLCLGFFRYWFEGPPHSLNDRYKKIPETELPFPIIDPTTKVLLHTMLPHSKSEYIQPELIGFIKKLENLRRHGANPTIIDHRGSMASSNISFCQRTTSSVLRKLPEENALQMINQSKEILEYLSRWEHEYQTSHTVESNPGGLKHDGAFVITQSTQALAGSSIEASGSAAGGSNLPPKYKWKGLRVEPVGAGDDFNWISPQEDTTQEPSTLQRREPLPNSRLTRTPHP